MKPILLIYGPSGVGKSTLAEYIADKLNFIHINFDNWDKKGIEGEFIKAEYYKFIDSNNPSDFVRKAQESIKENNKSGAVFTFGSHKIPKIENIKAGEVFGIKSIILYGTQKQCLNSFLEREKVIGPLIGRNISHEHWHKYNDHIYNGLTITESHNSYILNAFIGEKRKDVSDLLKEISDIISS